MNRYLCVHSHFYQPPRENPWLEAVEYQESAKPFHDWNERITLESYRPNGEARVLNNGQVIDIINNYARIHFNFGPTLLSWMEEKDPITYQKIIEGDRESLKHFGGHGSAIAQVYNHMIMPLANARDQETQILWGLADFKKRFQRDPESMWLAETAVDTATLELMAKHEMKYVILAPRQAKAFRSLGSNEEFTAIENEQFDLKVPYQISLPSGKSITAFFYDGNISKAIAFEGLLHNGETLVNRFKGAFDAEREGPQLLHIATDGETYGHHHRHGEMALAYALRNFEESEDATLINYGQFLEMFPPTMEAQIHENSSWSCVHGVERWRSDCGCNSGGHDWNQAWRGPLRDALDLIRDRLAPLYEQAASEFVKDPWKTRDQYIRIILDRSEESLAVFFKKHGKKELNDDEVAQMLKLLEMQRHLLLMYTSCGWFFDEISGIETVQNIQYAYRALDLAKGVLNVDLVEEFKNALEKAPSNLPDMKNGKVVFEKYVEPSKVDLVELGAHFAVASIFEKYGEKNSIYCYDVVLSDFQSLKSGRASLNYGRGIIRSRITHRSWNMMFGVLHLGDHNINAGVADFKSDEEYQSFVEHVSSAFKRADFPNVIRALDQGLGEKHYSLNDLFKNEQTRFGDAILKSSTQQIQDHLREIYENQYPLVCYFSDLKIPLPAVYAHIGEFIQNREIEQGIDLETLTVNADRLNKFLEEARRWKMHLDEDSIRRKLDVFFESFFNRMEGETREADLSTILQLVQFTRALPFGYDLAAVQTEFYLWRRKNSQAEERRISSELISQIEQELNIKAEA